MCIPSQHAPRKLASLDSPLAGAPFPYPSVPDLISSLGWYRSGRRSPALTSPDSLAPELDFSP